MINRREFLGVAAGAGMSGAMRNRFGAFGGAAVLALSLAAVAHTQQKAPDTAPMTDAQTAGAKRVKEVIDLLNAGDYAATRAYFEAQIDPNGLVNALARHHLSGGFDLIRVTAVPSRDDVVAGIVRSKLTGDEEYLAIRIEPQAPYRITLFSAAVAPEVVATWKLKLVTSSAETEEERLQEIGSYMKRMGDANMFSGAVVIARDGKPVFAQGYGYADQEKKVPNTVDTPFLLGSMNKMFTGLAIGQLVEQAKLSYEDALAKFLPDFPNPESAQKIKIKHLLSHTSGLGDYLQTRAYRDSLDRMVNVKALVDIFDRKPPAFEPGTKWAYSNMGFVLLGRVIEIVTGQDYYDYMQKHVFAPAGATSASYPLLPANGVAVVPMAYPYESTASPGGPRQFRNQLGVLFRRGGPDGNVVVSALDLIKLSNAMKAGRIVKAETLRLHSSPKPELGARTYGYGFAVALRYGRPFAGHNGIAPGQCTDFTELRDTPYTIVVLANVSFVCNGVVERILRVLRPS
jgi:CubicO group peptidase (beta-lactamase class C family)